MFNNLIESTSHRREIKRRSSFLFLTLAGYALLFTVAAVVSIQAVDAKLDEQNLEIVTIMNLVELPKPTPQTQVPADRPPSGQRNSQNDQNVFVRQIQQTRTDDPSKVPEGISAEPNKYLPMPKDGVVTIGGHDSDPSGGGNAGGNSTGSNNTGNKNLVVVTDPPPEVQVKKPVPDTIRKTVINSEATLLPKPPYPEIAKKFGAQGTVSIQVLIDITGKVVSAQVISGHPLLSPAARNAAYQARFSPTMIGDQPVKVSGIITYNFVINK